MTDMRERELNTYRERYEREYAEMKKKFCPYFKIECLMEKCIAFSGHCEKGAITLPHCQMFQDTEMLYDLAEILKPQWIESQQNYWKSLDEYEYHSEHNRYAVNALRKKYGIKEEIGDD